MCVDLVTPTKVNVTVMVWNVEVNGVYKHGNYERIWLKTLHVMSNVKVFGGEQSASMADMTDYIDPYDTNTYTLNNKYNPKSQKTSITQSQSQYTVRPTQGDNSFYKHSGNFW